MQDTVTLLGLQTSWGKFLQRFRCGCEPTCAQKSSFLRATESMGTTGWASVFSQASSGTLVGKGTPVPAPTAACAQEPGGHLVLISHCRGV